MSDYLKVDQMYKVRMVHGSDMLLAALRSQHPRIIDRLTRGRSTGDRK